MIVLRAWGLLRKARHEEPGGVLLASDSEKDILLTGASDKKVALSHLSSLILRCDRCSLGLQRCQPTSPAGWVAGFHEVIQGFSRSQVSGLEVPKVPFLSMKSKDKPSYTLAWLARGLMKSWMWRHGVEQLRKVDNTTLEEFAVCFPDEKDMFSAMVGAKGPRQQPLSKFFQAIKFQGPWELCTMVWCFCGNAVFDHVSAGDLEKAQKTLAALRVLQQKQQLGQNPTPAKLVAKHFQVRIKDDECGTWDQRPMALVSGPRSQVPARRQGGG